MVFFLADAKFCLPTISFPRRITGRLPRRQRFFRKFISRDLPGVFLPRKWWHSHRTGVRRYTGDDVCSTIKSGISCQHLQLMGGITNQNHSWPPFSGASPPGDWRFSAGTAQDFFTRAILPPEFQNWAWAKRKNQGGFPGMSARQVFSESAARRVDFEAHHQQGYNPCQQKKNRGDTGTREKHDKQVRSITPL